MKIKLLYFLLAFSFYVHAQDNTHSRVVYHAKHELASDFEALNGKNTLFFNTVESIFLHNNYPNERKSYNDGYYYNSISGDEEKFPFYISFVDSVSLSKVASLFDPYSLTILKEKLPRIKWSIESKQKKIKNYNCISAKAHHEGRDYEVWFTPDIPVGYGPYHLYGLPGLILEAKSLDGKVSWEFVGYEANSTEKMIISKPKNGEKMDWEQLIEARINLKIMKESKNHGEATLTISDPNEDLFIRKGKFSIYKNYFDKSK